MTDFYINTVIIGAAIGLGSTVWFIYNKYDKYLIKERKEHEALIRNLANSIRVKNENDYKLEVIKDLTDNDFSLLLTFFNDIEIQELQRIKKNYEDKLRREIDFFRLIEKERVIQERESRLQEIAKRFDYSEINNLSITDFTDVIHYLQDTQISIVKNNIAKARRANIEEEKKSRHNAEILREYLHGYQKDHVNFTVPQVFYTPTYTNNLEPEIHKKIKQELNEVKDENPSKDQETENDNIIII